MIKNDVEKIKRLHKELHHLVTEMYSGVVINDSNNKELRFIIHARGETVFQVVPSELLHLINEDEFIESVMNSVHQNLLKKLRK